MKDIGRYTTVVLMAILLELPLPVGSARSADRMVEGGPVPVSALADESLEGRLTAALRSIDAYENLTVTIANGVVKLSGRTGSFAAAERAVDLAARFEGVLYVVDDIAVEAELDSRLAPAWRKMSQLLDNAVGLLPLAAVALLIFAGLGLLGWLATAWDWPYRRLGDRVLLKNLVRQLIRYTFVLAGLLIALEILELTSLFGAVVGAAGLFGLAVGFALKDIVENYIAGFLLSIRSPFGFMDWVAIEDHEGSVVRVTSRELVIITLQGNHVRIPNAHVFKSVITNYTRNPLRRFDIPMGIGVAEDLSRVQRIGCRVLAALKGVVPDPAPIMRNIAFGESAMDVVFSGWVDQQRADFLKVRSEAVRILKEALEEAGIEIPFPIRTVFTRVAEDRPRAVSKHSEMGAGIFQEAEKADVGREDHLEDQIRRERQGSDEVDLLGGDTGPSADKHPPGRKAKRRPM